MPILPLRPWLAVSTVAALLATGGALTFAATAPDRGYLALDAAVGLSCAVVGALVFSRRPSLGWLLVLGGWGLSAQAASGGYAVAAREFGWPLEAAAFWVTNWIFLVGLMPLLLLPLLLPDGRLPSPGWRPVLLLLGALGTALTGVLMLRDEAWAWGVVVDNPVGRFSTDDVVAPVFATVTVLYAVVGTVAVVSRLRRGDESERRQLYPPLAAVLALAAAVVADVLLPADPPIGTWLVGLALTLLPVSVAFTVFRHRLFEIEVAVRRTLTYAITAVILLLLYRGVVGLTDLTVVAAAVVAVLFTPVRDLVGRGLAHTFFGDRGDPSTAITALGRRLENSSEAPLAEAARVVAVTLRLPGAAVLDAEGRVISTYGDVEPDGFAVPVIAAGRVEGELRGARRSPEEELSPTDRAVLAALARPLATALVTARLDTEVRRSRERLVSAREEERRRLRRELHDGLGPGLAAIGMELDLAIALPGAEPGVQATGRARQLAGTLISDVRRIVHELRPAALDELGLVGALEDLALSPGAGPRVRVVSADLPDLPAAVEVAAYRIAQEALANAIRHAEAATVTVSVAVVEGWLVLEVHDDGRGIADGIPEGVGSGSMRERTAELGGRYRRTRGPGGGTIVRAELPL